MVTRPLDLARRLRPPPRSFDALFFVNAVLIALFFFFFGSRFVLSPVLKGTDTELVLPGIDSSAAALSSADFIVTIMSNSQIYVDVGFVTEERLPAWFEEKAKKSAGGSLLIVADVRVPIGLVTSVYAAAKQAGLKVKLVANVKPQAPTGP